MAPRRAGQVQDQCQARGLHHGDPRQCSGLRAEHQDGRDQLPLRAQEAEVQALGPGSDQGDHAPGEQGERVASGLHCRRRAPTAHQRVPLLPQVPQPEEAYRRWLLALGASDDHGEDHQALQGPRRSSALRHAGDGAQGCAARCRDGHGLLEEVLAAPRIHARRDRPLDAPAGRRHLLVRSREPCGRGHGCLLLLLAALYDPGERQIQPTEGGLLLLERGDDRAAPRAHVRRVDLREAARL
mmetsp:Transcript_45712/g.103758  ORF Transcript_45712/g.103758 Transcript_45712/m.103758 type:complete len:241 (+) Transcript_45712:456-1178(+)